LHRPRGRLDYRPWAGSLTPLSREGRRRARQAPKRPAGQRTLVNRLKPNQTPASGNAELVVEGIAMNAVTAVGYSQIFGGRLDLGECMEALVVQTQAVQSGDLSAPETMLAAQAVTLNAMFTQLAYQASKTTIVAQIDLLIRLALKAQGQSRATVETLALIKNPRSAVFAKQANIAHGPQQVNNTLTQARGASLAEGSRAGDSEREPNRLLEADGQRLDARTTSSTGTGYQAVAPVGARHRPTHT
jgi:hypothetical protein